MRSGKQTRGNMIGFTLDVILWAVERRSAFTIYDFMEAHGIVRRNALRWLQAMEARGLIEVVGRSQRGDSGQWYTMWRAAEAGRQLAEIAA